MNIILMVIQRKQNERYIEYEKWRDTEKWWGKKKGRMEEREGGTALIYNTQNNKR